MSGEVRQFDGPGYEQFQKFLHEVSGIVLGKNKEYLVRCRLNKIMDVEEIETLSQLVKILQKGQSHRLKDKVVDAMTTNETFWFRDVHPYTILEEEVLHDIVKNIGMIDPIRIWSAACSSGQEPYSISMTVSEFIEKNKVNLTGGVQIIATDISPTMLNDSRAGVYDSLAMGRGLSEHLKEKYFEEQEDGCLAITNSVKRRVSFRLLNLLEPFISLQKFHIIFCRNVLIYFSPEAKKDILRRMAESLQPGGYLFLGGTESIGVASEYYEMCHMRAGIVYRKK